MNHYKQLTVADRKVVETLLIKNYNLKEIAKILGRDKSTICREIKRCPKDKYTADLAQLVYDASRSRCKYPGKIIFYDIKDLIISHVKKGWSPEQIYGRLTEVDKLSCPCVETIYNFIYTYPPNREERLYQYLRRGKKKRTKQHGRRAQTEKIANKVSIHQRPEEVLSRSEFGHFEGDSVIYPNKKAINTLNELKTGIVKFTKLERKTAGETKEAIINGLKTFYKASTLTLDNGTEFMEHQEINRQSKVDIYFCDPYSSWQRGANENANMLLRGYLPKRKNIDELTQEDLNDIAEELNNRPRKRLQYKTPNEAYSLDLFNAVALESRM